MKKSRKTMAAAMNDMAERLSRASRTTSRSRRRRRASGSRPKKPPAVVVYSPDTGQDEAEEWYLYPATWDHDYHADINVDCSGWTADFDQDLIAGPFTSSEDAQKELKLLGPRAYEVDNRVGCLQLRRCRASGTMVGIYHARQAGIEQDPTNPWATVCEDHSSLLLHPTLALARSHAAWPDWCAGCQARLEEVNASWGAA